jgi:hypothetical protein
MQSLDKLREGWDEFERRKRHFADDLTIEQSVGIFLLLQESLGPLMDETEELFRPEREAYLAELQRRLRQLEDWRRHGSAS